MMAKNLLSPEVTVDGDDGGDGDDDDDDDGTS